MTHTQKTILDVVINSNQHLSADEIYLLVKDKLPKVALGTIYRNLNQFADMNLIRRVSRVDAADYYEVNTTPHDHAICIRCGKMTDVKIDGLKELLKDQIKGDIISFDLVVNYVCHDCAKKD